MGASRKRFQLNNIAIRFRGFRNWDSGFFLLEQWLMLLIFQFDPTGSVCFWFRFGTDCPTGSRFYSGIGISSLERYRGITWVNGWFATGNRRCVYANQTHNFGSARLYAMGICNSSTIDVAWPPMGQQEFWLDLILMPDDHRAIVTHGIM